MSKFPHANVASYLTARGCPAMRYAVRTAERHGVGPAALVVAEPVNLHHRAVSIALNARSASAAKVSTSRSTVGSKAIGPNTEGSARSNPDSY